MPVNEAFDNSELFVNVWVKYNATANFYGLYFV